MNLNGHRGIDTYHVKSLPVFREILKFYPNTTFENVQNPDILTFMLSKEIDQTTIHNWFFTFCGNGYYELVQIILKRITDPAVRGVGLLKAVNGKYSRIVRLILEYHVPLASKNQALYETINKRRSDLEIVMLLVDSGANLKDRVVLNRVKPKNPEVFEFLEDRGIIYSEQLDL